MDTSCCREEPRCFDDGVCHYYNPRLKGKVRLGGIFDPREPAGSTEEQLTDQGPSELDEERLRQKEQEQLTQCEEKAKKWSLDFMKRTCGVACDDSSTAWSKPEEKVQAATDRIVEKFGGLTLGFSGPVPSTTSTTAETKTGYQGLKSSRAHKMKPDYPEDLHMRRMCRTRRGSSRQKRLWDDDDGGDMLDPIPSFSPQTTPSLMDTSDTGTSSNFLVTPLGTRASIPKSAEKQKHMPVSADQMIRKYIEKYNLAMMLEYFLALACLQGQDNPFIYISDVAGKMVRARDNEEEFLRVDRLFTAEHVSALFRLFDKEQNGYVNLTQYKTAMETLGLVSYNRTPEGHDIDKITEPTFVPNATKALDLLLRSFLKVEIV